MAKSVYIKYSAKNGDFKQILIKVVICGFEKVNAVSQEIFNNTYNL